MRNMLLIIVLMTFTCQFVSAQKIYIWDEKGNPIVDPSGIPLSQIDSVVFRQSKVVLDEEFDADPLSNGWKYTGQRNYEANVTYGNSSAWVKDSIYGDANEPRGIEMTKDLDEPIYGFVFSARAVINATAYPNTSPIVKYGIIDQSGQRPFFVEITKDTCKCWYRGNMVKAHFVGNLQNPVISISWDGKRGWANYIYYKINDGIIYEKDYLDALTSPITKAFVSIMNKERTSAYSGKIDFIRVSRFY